MSTVHRRVQCFSLPPSAHPPPRPALTPPALPRDCSPHAAQRFTLRVPLGSDGEAAKALPRLDAFVSAALPRGASRARVTAAIKAGALTVNGRVVTKPSSQVRLARLLHHLLWRCCADALGVTGPPGRRAAPEPHTPAADGGGAGGFAAGGEAMVCVTRKQVL